MNGFFPCKNPIVLAKDFKTNPIWTVKQLNLQGANISHQMGPGTPENHRLKSDGINGICYFPGGCSLGLVGASWRNVPAEAVGVFFFFGSSMETPEAVKEKTPP